MTPNPTLGAFLHPFEAAFGRRLETEAAAGAFVCDPDPALTEFRRDPAPALAALSSRFDELWRALPGDRVIWLCAGSTRHGLDDFEAEALLGRWMAVDAIRASVAGDEKRLAAFGSLRGQIALLAFRPASADVARALIHETRAATVPFMVFLDADTAASLAADPSHARAWRDATANGSVAAALWVPSARTAAALAHPAEEVAALHTLTATSVWCVRFESMAGLQPQRLDQFMRESGCACDSSMAPGEARTPDGELRRRGPYAGTAPYCPLPYDFRIPWCRPSVGDWFEIAATPLGSGGIGAWWDRGFDPSDEEFVSRLDAARMEEHFRLSAIVPSEERRYPDIRVYNWPKPEPAIRVTLIDAGVIADARPAAACLADAAALRDRAGRRVRFAGADDFIRAAREAIAARFATSARDALAIQHDEHAYLEAIASETRLRADYAEFASFLPASLGQALEVGSGYGALASILALRARRYVCFDLDSTMFGVRRDGQALDAVAGDVHRLPFRDGSFSTLVANNVLEHLYNPVDGFAEIRRVLEPGGRVFALIPLDALNSRHELRAHHWKVDLDTIASAVAHSNLDLVRLVPLSLYQLDVPGAFPSCNGYSAMLEARKPDGQHVCAAAGWSPIACEGRAAGGRRLASVHEVARFHDWTDRRVVVIGEDASEDVAEFARFGADVRSRRPCQLGSEEEAADLVYAFLSIPPRDLGHALKDVYRVLRDGGTFVGVFRNERSLHLAARVRAFAGRVCGLDDLIGEDETARLIEGDESVDRAGYVAPEAVECALGRFCQRHVVCRELSAADVPRLSGEYPPPFWSWLAGACGRFVMARAIK